MNKYQPRYQLFVDNGGGQNWEFLSFIAEMKQRYIGSDLNGGHDRIRDQDAFTEFIGKEVQEASEPIRIKTHLS